MIKTIKFSAPQLSQLKEVDVDLELTGKHYRDLKLSEGRLPEEVMLSILKDLVKNKDANKLTLNEAKYVFTMIKINSLQNDYQAIVKCTHKKEDGSVCGHENKFEIHLSDSDLKFTPKNYKAPKLEVVIGNTQKEYTILPPTVDMEIALYDYFVQNKNTTPDEIVQDKEKLIQFNWMRNMLHLVDVNGERLIKEMNDLENSMEWMDKNKFSTINQLNDSVKEVNSYGFSDTIHEDKCKECGGILIFHLPLLHGLSD